MQASSGALGPRLGYLHTPKDIVGIAGGCHAHRRLVKADGITSASLGGLREVERLLANAHIRLIHDIVGLRLIVLLLES